MRADAGKPRGAYDMTWRALKKLAEDARRTAIVAGRKAQVRRARTRRQRRVEHRANALPVDRRCPSCGRVVLESRRWVVTQEGARCLSCHRTSSRE